MTKFGRECLPVSHCVFYIIGLKKGGFKTFSHCFGLASKIMLVSGACGSNIGTPENEPQALGTLSFASTRQNG